MPKSEIFTAGYLNSSFVFGLTLLCLSSIVEFRRFPSGGIFAAPGGGYFRDPVDKLHFFALKRIKSQTFQKGGTFQCSRGCAALRPPPEFNTACQMMAKLKKISVNNNNNKTGPVKTLKAQDRFQHDMKQVLYA